MIIMVSNNEKKQYSIEIIGIDPSGTSVKILSPMKENNPIPIKKGTRLAIHESPKGGEPLSHIVVAGPDPKNPHQPYQYYDDEIENWVLIVQQPEDRPIASRSAIRVETAFDVTLTLTESSKVYNARSEDLSSTGMLISVNTDDEIPKDSKVVLEFQLPGSSYELPPITGKIVRSIKKGNYLIKSYSLGVEFDDFKLPGQSSSEETEGKERAQNKNDQDEIIRYVLKRQNL